MHIKKIKFERTGGFAGIRLHAEIDMDDLPKEEKREILEILDEADLDKLPKELSSNRPIPDEFTYSIIVESDEKENKIFAGESSMHSDLEPLIEILERFAKSQMRKKTD